jgi:hypothetical protein
MDTSEREWEYAYLSDNSGRARPRPSAVHATLERVKDGLARGERCACGSVATGASSSAGGELRFRCGACSTRENRAPNVSLALRERQQRIAQALLR